MASPNVNLVKYLAFSVSLQWFLVKKLKKEMAKNAKKSPKSSHFLMIFQFFFQKILLLSPPKLLYIHLPFMPTYSQSDGHLGVKFFSFFFPF